LQIV